MIHKMMIRTFIAAVAMLALSREALAQGVPQLKELVTVTGDIVRIGDLIDNAGAAEFVAVFRAPDLGHTGTVPVKRIADALRPHGITEFDNGAFSEVVVTRLSRAITAKEIEERIARALGGHYGFGEARGLQVNLGRDVRTMHVEAQSTAELSIARIYVDQRLGRFDISIELPGSAAARRLPLRFVGTVADTVETATLTRTLARGEVIRASDVVVERKPKYEVSGEGIDAAQAIGLATKRPLRAGQALRPADLMKPEVVQRNETVTIVYEVPGIVLTVRGKVLDAGAVGDVVNVLNIQSNRTLQATVIGPGRVSIASTLPRVAAASQNSARRSAE